MLPDFKHKVVMIVCEKIFDCFISYIIDFILVFLVTVNYYYYDFIVTEKASINSFIYDTIVISNRDI